MSILPYHLRLYTFAKYHMLTMFEMARYTAYFKALLKPLNESSDLNENNRLGNR